MSEQCILRTMYVVAAASGSPPLFRSHVGTMSLVVVVVVVDVCLCLGKPDYLPCLASAFEIFNQEPMRRSMQMFSQPRSLKLKWMVRLSQHTHVYQKARAYGVT